MAIHHRILRAAFAGLALWLLFVAWAQSDLRIGAPREGQRLLVLHDPENAVDAILAANLTGRFGRATLRPIAGYRAGDARRFDAMLVMPSAPSSQPPQALLADVAASRGPVIWIQHAIGRLFAGRSVAARAGWSPAPERPADWVAVRYKGRDFPRDLRVRTGAAEPLVADPSRAQILAVAVGPGGRETPWAVRAGPLLYVAESPFAYAHEDDRYLVFADLLFEMLAPDAPERHRAMVRIDDIGPEADPRSIRRLVDLLAGENVPFGLAVRDTYSAFRNGRPAHLTLRQRPRLVRALRDAVSRGGALIAQGRSGGRIWPRAGLPRPAIFAGAPGRPPSRVRWDRPSYSAGDRRQAQFVPFEVVDVRGDLVVPENLGLVSRGRGPERLIASARRNLAVRDGFAGFAFAWHEDPQTLAALVRGVRGAGYRFVGPEDVVRDAPAHAVSALHRPAPLAAAASGWVGALPHLHQPLLLALLALTAGLWFAAERLLRLIPLSARRWPAFGGR
jgi:hypothetical protein